MRATVSLLTILLASSSAAAEDPRPRVELAMTRTAPTRPDDPREALAAEGAAPAPSPSVAVGTPARGRLRDGAALEPSPVLALKRGSERNRFGTAELVGLVERAAARVAERLPGGRLLVGDLSREDGGRLRPHRSHRNGLDADLGLYAVDLEGQPVHLERFVRFREDGSARGEHEGVLRFDDERNWHLVEALLADAHTRVTRIFVSSGLRARLLDTGARLGASDLVLARAELILQSHGRGAGGHDDHVHVRIDCPADDLPHCVPMPLGPALEAAVDAV